jgi:hypothetical protein
MAQKDEDLFVCFEGMIEEGDTLEMVESLCFFSPPCSLIFPY